MPGRSARSLLAAASTGVLVVAAAAAAHVAAGGTVDGYALIGLAALSIAVSTTLASRVRLTFVRAVTATLLLQPVMHTMLGHGTGMTGDAASHAHHDMAMPAASTHVVSSMAASHAAVALVCAGFLRWGVRWLRSMPAVGRALVVRARTVVVPIVLPRDRAPAIADTAAAPLAVLVAWDNRGPPR